MSTRYYDLPGIRHVAIRETPGPDVHCSLYPDTEHPNVSGLGPVTIIGQPVSVERLLLAWARSHDEQAAHRSGDVIRVSSTRSDDHPAISECGDLTTVGALRKGEAP